MSLIQAENLTKVYGTGDTAVVALDHVNLTVNPGEFVAVMGPSGCGKSTLLHLLGGLDRPTDGEVLFEDQDLAKMDDSSLTQLRRRRMGFVFQFFNLIPVLDATENAALPLTLDGAARAEERANDWLVKVGLGDRLTNRPDQLSGGQQQRVAVARALSTEPALILADEPTGNCWRKCPTMRPQSCAGARSVSCSSSLTSSRFCRRSKMRRCRFCWMGATRRRRSKGPSSG